ncbi:hypothetical protein CPB86DRAFT_718137 [Serendipita vermifera]|nr:hypothetical protein CPB86DRAFT_718137 [Serendipita vermifera]
MPGRSKGKQSTTNLLSPAPIPASTCCWHRRDINSVRFSPDGRLIASAADDHRVLVSNVSTRQKLHDLIHDHAEVNAIVWLGRAHGSHRLATGTRNGIINLWELKTKGRHTKSLFREFNSEVRMLEYSVELDRLLVIFSTRIFICSLGLSKEEDLYYHFDQKVGGGAFLTPGIRCIVTIPKQQKM